MSLTTNDVEKTCQNCRYIKLSADNSACQDCRKNGSLKLSEWQPIADLPAVPDLALARVRAEVVKMEGKYQADIDTCCKFADKRFYRLQGKRNACESILEIIDRESSK